MMLVRLQPDPCFAVHAFSFNGTFPVTFCTVCSQCTDGITKLVHVYNLVSAEWIGSLVVVVLL